MALLKIDLSRVNQIKVGGHPYIILLPYNFVERSDLNGQIVFDAGEIRIADTTPEGYKRTAVSILKTIIHEILHAFDTDYAIGLFEDDENERKLKALSQVITTFLLENDFIEVVYS